MCDFQPISRFISRTVRDRAQFTMNHVVHNVKILL